MANPALIAKAAAIILTDEKARKAVGWTLVAILSPLILLIAFLCALGSGATEHNITAAKVFVHSKLLQKERRRGGNLLLAAPLDDLLSNEAMV